jgi:hypothetical protein
VWWQGPAYDSDIVAFFPGYPIALRLVHFVVRNWVVSGVGGSPERRWPFLA